MSVELSQHELDLLDKALDAYERESSASAFTASLLGVMITPKEGREETKAKMHEEMEAAAQEGKQRRYATTLLRAKLYQAAAKQSEHELTPLVNSQP